MSERFNALLGSLKAALVRFPLVVPASVVAFASVVYLHHTSWDAAVDAGVVRLLLASLAALPLGIAAGWAGEATGGAKALSSGAALGLMCAIWLLLPEETDLAADQYRCVALMVGAAALALAVPGAGGDKAAWKSWVGLLQAAVLGAILGGIVALGLFGAAYSVEVLFGVELGRLNGDLFFFSVFLVTPLAVILLLPPADRGAAAAFGAGFWQGLCKWVLVPLGFLFGGILAAYAVSIVLQRELPDGMVATPVLLLGAYGTAAMLLLQPWRESDGWARRFARVYPVSYLLFSILLFLAISLRIGEYGMTIGRYVAVGFGLWFLLGSAVFLMRPRRGFLWVAGSLALLAVVSTIGPASAAAISLRSQSAILQELLREPRSSATVPRANSVLRYMVRCFGVSSVEKVVGPLNLRSADKGRVWADQAVKKLGLDLQPEQLLEFKSDETAPVRIGDYTSLRAPGPGSQWCDLGPDDDGKPLAIGHGFKVLADRKKVAELLPGVLEKIRAKPDASEPLYFPFSVGGRDFCLVVLGLQSDTDPQVLHSVHYVVLEK